MGRKYERERVREDSKDEQDLLDNGWEPFAVTKEFVYEDRHAPWRSTGEANFVWYRRAVDVTE